MWESISWEVDFVRIDFVRIDLVGVDFLRVDLMAPNPALAPNGCYHNPMRVLPQHANLWPPSHMPWITTIFWLKQFHKSATNIGDTCIEIDEWHDTSESELVWPINSSLHEVSSTVKSCTSWKSCIVEKLLHTPTTNNDSVCIPNIEKESYNREGWKGERERENERQRGRGGTLKINAYQFRIIRSRHILFT